MESRAKVKSGSGKHGVYTHFPKDPNCDNCLKTKITRASCRRRTGTVVPRAEHFGVLITADHKKMSVKEVNRVTIIDMPWWYKIWQRSGYNPTHVKQKLLRRPKRAHRSSWSQRGSQKSFTLTIPEDLASPVRNYPGIIVRQRHTDQKQMGLQKGPYVE